MTTPGEARQHNTITDFRKSSYSQNSTAQCVEVADCTCHHSMRDSVNPHLGAIDFDRPAWQSFMTLVRQ